MTLTDHVIDEIAERMSVSLTREVLTRCSNKLAQEAAYNYVHRFHEAYAQNASDCAEMALICRLALLRKAQAERGYDVYGYFS